MTQESRDSFSVSAEELLQTVKDLIHEGNVRRITIKSKDGDTKFEVPLTIGVIGVALLPIYAAVAGVALLATGFTITVERRDPAESDEGDDQEGS